MGHPNDVIFLKQYLKQWSHSSVLEVGSKRYNMWAQDYRSLFQTNRFIGLDQEPGDGVDCVHDLETGSLDEQFEMVLCCSVLEHTRSPWKAALNVSAMVKPGGYLYVSAPWAWREHGYPIDNWRFSCDGLKTLFPGYQWIAETYGTTKLNDFQNKRIEGISIIFKNPQLNTKHESQSICVAQQSYVLGVKQG